MSGHATSRRHAFTLLEVIVATMIVAMLSLTLYRFLAAHLTAVRTTTELRDEREALESVSRLLAAQLSGLPARGRAMLEGRSYRFRGLHNDEITWRCSPGPGLLTTAASGEYRVTLTVQPVNAKSAETELGLRRRPIDPIENSQVALDRGGGDQNYNWVPLIRPISALEIGYFDSQLNSWLEAWTDPDRYPDLVRIRLWKRPNDAPVEAVLPVPAAKLQQ